MWNCRCTLDLSLVKHEMFWSIFENCRFVHKYLNAYCGLLWCQNLDYKLIIFEEVRFHYIFINSSVFNQKYFKIGCYFNNCFILYIRSEDLCGFYSFKRQTKLGIKQGTIYYNAQAPIYLNKQVHYCVLGNSLVFARPQES